MAIVRVDPFREFATLQDRVNRLFGNVYLRDEDVNGPSTWTPPVDIYETDGRDLVIKAELPDMTREDIEVTVANDTLTLRGERKRSKRRQGGPVPPCRAAVRRIRPLVQSADDR